MRGYIVLTSSKSHNWITGPDLYSYLYEKYGPFTVDPCSTSDNVLGTPRYFYYRADGLRFLTDGLLWDWGKEGDVAYMNPPFNAIPTWLARAIDQRDRLGVRTLSLLPSRTGTSWFHDYIFDKETGEYRPGIEVEFLRGRPNFIDAKTRLPASSGATFDCMAVNILPRLKR